MEEKLNAIGCPDPFSIAEFIEGTKIDWSKQKDEIETLAECLGVTKAGYLNNINAILRPFAEEDSKGTIKILSKDAAQKRLETLMTKIARPQNSTKILKSASNLTFQQKRKNVVSILMNVQESQKVINQKIKSGEITATTDAVYLPKGMSWKDKGYYFNETVHWYDICQNSIADCYYLAALCSVAFVNPFLIKNVTGLRFKYSEGIQDETPWHAIEYYVPNGTYESSNAWSHAKKTTQTIVVSEEVLVNASGYNYGASGPKEKLEGLVKGDKSKLDSCWPAVYEKAYAKFLERCTSDYPNMDGPIHYGNAEDSLKVILHTEDVETKYLSNLTTSQIWSLAGDADTKPSCASISAPKVGTEADYTNMGLYTYHVYSLLGRTTINNKQYVILRNPHGRNPIKLKNNAHVYQSSWSVANTVSANNTYRGTKDIYRLVDGNNNPQKSRGTFLMEIAEFKRVFTAIERYNGATISNGSTSLTPSISIRPIPGPISPIDPIQIPKPIPEPLNPIKPIPRK